MRILAFTPTWDDAMAPETAASVRAQQVDGSIRFDWIVSRDNPYPVPDHRNVLAQYCAGRERCLDGNYDALLTVEHDMVLPLNAIQELANTRGDVIYGVYLFRWGSFVLNTFEYVGNRNIGESLSLHPNKARAAIQSGKTRVSGAGWGCTLIRRHVLQALPFPAEYPENPAYDIAFAQRCVRHPFTMVANFRVLCGHKKTTTIIRNTRRTDVYETEIIWPFQDESIFDYNGHEVVVAGQSIPMYKRIERRPRNVDVIARQTINISVAGETKRLRAGVGYNLPRELAHELARAAYVEVLSVS